MTIVIGGNFQTSEIKKRVNPNSNISNNIEELEKLFIDLELFDETKELFGTPFSQIFYKKDGEEVCVIGLSQSKFYLKLSGYNWDLEPFLQLPMENEFSIEKTLSWRLLNVEKVEPIELVAAVRKSINNTKDLSQLMRFILIVISAYVKKSSFLNEEAKELQSLVLEYFWKGEINAIGDLYKKSIHSKGEHFNVFTKKWKKQLSYDWEIADHQISNEMNLNRIQLTNLFKTIKVYFEQSINKYIHSIKNLWFDADLIKDEVKFYEKVKEIRSRVLLAHEFLNDMQVLISEEESEIERQSEDNNEIDSGDVLSQFLCKKGDSSKLFYDKEDLITGDPTLVINENTLDKLAGVISNGNKNKKEYCNLIRIIFNKSLTKGFTVREIVRTFFIGNYDNESERKDIEQRYDVKRLFVKSTLENVFETIIEKLVELNVIKKEISLIQAKRQEKITFNYNIKIYDTY